MVGRDEFLSVASHELRTPLTSLRLEVGNLLRLARRNECHGYEARATPTGPRARAPKPIAFAQFSKYVRQPTGQMPPHTIKSVPDKDLPDISRFSSRCLRRRMVSSIPALR